MKKESTYNQEINGGEEVVGGKGQPTGDASVHDNMAGAEEGASDNVSDSEAEADNATEEAAEKSAENEAEVWRDKYIRLQAEFDNFRKRTLREKMDLIQSGGSDVLKAMLPVLDDVIRAVGASEKSDDINALREGEKHVMQKFIDTLRQKNVTEIEAVGADFDPDLHEAVAKFAAGEDKKGKVIDVVQRGYMLGEKVLRFAKVVVGE